MITGPGTKTHLVIPDGHARPGDDMTRFKAVSHLIDEVRPDVIVCLGDLWDLPSLSVYDGARAVGGAGGNKRFEGRRLADDIYAGAQALRELTKITDEKNARHRATNHHNRQYLPERYFLEGNHEERIRRVANHIPELDGFVGAEDLKAATEEGGWMWMNFLSPLRLSGIFYSHYFTSGVKGNPVASARNALQNNHATQVWGHSHRYDHATATRPDGSAIHAINAGCLIPEGRGGPSGSHWWRGVLLLTVLGPGDVAITQVPLSQMMARYQLAGVEADYVPA